MFVLTQKGITKRFATTKPKKTYPLTKCLGLYCITEIEGGYVLPSKGSLMSLPLCHQLSSLQGSREMQLVQKMEIQNKLENVEHRLDCK